jgi:alkylhydroperoxidase family enzyme
VAEEQGIDRRKIEATWDIEDPIFTPRERAALEMASLFSEDYHAISDEHFARWREFFDDEELVELGTFLAVCDGFGKLVEMLGLGAQEQVCEFEV